MLVIGSRNSSNSNRLVEVAREHGADSHLIDNETEVREEWLDGKRVVGITSGASAPEELVQRLVEFFRARGTTDVQELEVVQEDVRFMLPKAIRQAMAAAAWPGHPLRTLVISDLHLGATARPDVLRRRPERARWSSAVCGRRPAGAARRHARAAPRARCATRSPRPRRCSTAIGAALGPDARS